jgi:hypothetical protein
MSKQKEIGAVLAEAHSLCPPYGQQEVWQSLPVPADIRRPPENPAEMLAKLQAKFPDAALLESGVVAMTAEGDMRLNPGLCDANTALLALRNKPQAAPFDLLTDRGCVATGAMPLCASLLDAQTRKLLRTNNCVLCAASSSADAVALLSLGIPTTLAAGLAELNGDSLEELSRRYQLGKYAPGRGGIRWPDDTLVPQVMVVGWSPAKLTLEEPAVLSAIVSHLSDIERHLEICLDRFSLWQLTPKELEGIEFRMKQFGPSSVKTALWKSLMACKRKVVPPWTYGDVPKDLATAIQALHKSLSNPARTADDERRAWEQALRLVQSQATAPWLGELEDAGDGAERALIVSGALSSQISQIQGLQIVTKMTCITGQKGVTQPRIPGDELFQQYLKSSDLVIKTVKALEQYRKNAL